MSKRRRITLALAIIVLFPASVGAIDLFAYARAPALTSVAISPDGAHLSYVVQSNARQNVVLRTRANERERHALNLNPSEERVRWCEWAGSRYLLCGTIRPVRSEEAIYERTRLYAIDATNLRVRELNEKLESPMRDEVIDFVGSKPGRVLLQHDSVGRGYPDVSELDVATGQLTRIVRAHPPVRRWLSDGRGQVRLGIGYDDGEGSLWIRNTNDAQWTLWIRQEISDLNAIGPLAFGARANELYALKHHQGRAALFQFELGGSPQGEMKFADPIYDISGPLLFESASRKLLGVRYFAGEPRIHFFDAAAEKLHAVIDERLPGVTNTIEAVTADDRWLLIRSESDVDPPSTYLFDAAGSTLQLIGHHYPELEDTGLAPMRPVIYRARDGQRIPSYLTLPDSAAAAPVAAIVLPHGGPESRTHRGFDPLVQFLAAQGYAVLQMNFRGSLGYGARFAAAGVGQWGGVIHNDITDGARWLVEQGIADPERMCIVGQSFGGYAALLGAAREAQWYSCAAAYAAPTDLIALAQYMRRVWRGQLWKERLGQNERALWQMSPLSRTSTIEIPVLLVHGRLDPVVPVSQARRFARALRLSNKSHHFIERSDCDHDLTIESCRLVFYGELRTFLAGAIGEAGL